MSTAQLRMEIARLQSATAADESHAATMAELNRSLAAAQKAVTTLQEDKEAWEQTKMMLERSNRDLRAEAGMGYGVRGCGLWAVGCGLARVGVGCRLWAMGCGLWAMGNGECLGSLTTHLPPVGASDKLRQDHQSAEDSLQGAERRAGRAMADKADLERRQLAAEQVRAVYGGRIGRGDMRLVLVVGCCWNSTSYVWREQFWGGRCERTRVALM